MEHVIRISEGRTPEGAATYRARCTCGYAGGAFSVRVHAERDGDEHQIQMARAGQ